MIHDLREYRKSVLLKLCKQITLKFFFFAINGEKRLKSRCFLLIK